MSVKEQCSSEFALSTTNVGLSAMKEEAEDEAKEKHYIAMERNESLIKGMLARLPEVDKYFNVHKKIGEGTFSNVYLATIKAQCDVKEPKKFAIKHLIPTCHPKRIKSELDCLLMIGGKDNVVPCLSSVRRFDCVIFIMPYLEHQKFADYVADMDVDEARLYMKNLLLALKRVHSFNVIHRDVKPSNFLYNRQTKQFLLVDFGLAQSLYDDMPCLKPEIVVEPIKKRKRDEENSDVEEKSCAPQIKRPALQSLPNESMTNQLNRSKPHQTYENRKLLNKSGRQNQPLSSMQRMAEASQVRRNLENSLNSYNSSQVKKDSQDIGLGQVKRQPLMSSNSVNVLHNSPKKMPPVLPSFQNILPQKSTDTGPSFVRVQNSKVQDGSMFTKPKAPVWRAPVCDCQGKPQVCNTCLVRKSQNAPRAGTPGFRPPEVLLRYHYQTTAVDMWSCGVIMLCILSGCYPFFRSPDDVTSLSEIMTIFGYESISKVAKKLGRNIISSENRKPLYLRALCERLQSRKRDGEPWLKLPICESCHHSIDPVVGCVCEDKYKSPSCSKTYPDSAYDLLKKLLDIDPDSRISAEDAFNHPFLADINITC